MSSSEPTLYLLLASLALGAASARVAPSPDTFDVRAFGAVGNGETDDSRAFQQALDAAAKNGGKVFIPRGVYVVSNLRVGPHTEVYGVGVDSVLRVKSGPTEAERSAYALSVNPGRDGSSDPEDNARDITFRAFQIQGTVAADGFFEHKHLLNLNAVTGVLVDNVAFAGFRGDAIYLGSGNVAGLERHNRRVTIRHCRFDGVNNDNRNAISVIDGAGVLIEGNKFYNSTRKGQPGPIDLEPDPGAGPYAVLRDVVIRKNEFENCGGNGAVTLYTKPIRLTRHLSSLTIRNNYISSTNHFGVAAIWICTGEDLASNIPSMRVRIANNRIHVKAPTRPIWLSRVVGAAVVGNEIRDGGSTVLGNTDQSGPTVEDCVLQDNTFTDCSGPQGTLVLGSVARVRIVSNRFVRARPGDRSAIGLVGEGATTTSTYLSISENTFVKGPQQTHMVAVSGHRTDRSNLRLDHNVVEGDVNLVNDLTKP